MEIKNAMQIKNGETTDRDTGHYNSFTQPLQFLPLNDKDEDWAMHNLDWLEWQGVQQISANAHRLMKNYKLAKGTIDKIDYMPVENTTPTDITEMIDLLSSDSINDQNQDSAMELKFYPIIPTVINVLVAEFAKKNSKVTYQTEDEYSYNEIMTAKMAEIEEVLMEDAYAKLTKKMIDMGLDPQSEEAQQQLNPDVLKKLPEIEEFYSKTYQTLGEQWATKQHDVDVLRFHMDELEEIAFRDMLITDREFWHFRMMEDDYDVELWNPVLTFYHKSPSVRYISEGNWVGKVDLYTVSDVLELMGPILTEEQQESLESLHPIRGGRMLLNDLPNDGSYYNSNQSHEDNLNSSLQMKRWLSNQENTYNPDDLIDWIVGQGENGTLHNDEYLRVTTAYWKTQRKLGYLTSVGEGGEVIVKIIDETYVVANNPIYHSNTSSQHTAQTLVFGDHIDWVWINQVYGGRKIGPNRAATMTNFEDREEFCPIYVGIESNKIGPMRYQFKGDNTLYGCKLPVEGKVFTERNTKSTALVDLMKPSQIGYNMVCNQIQDIIIDELGTVVAIDQNALPQHSMDEDWGKGNYAKAYVAMKDFSILPLDTSLQNTENALNFQHYQTLNLEQSGRLITRIQIANFFKQQALEVIGFTPQRLGQQIGQTDTAKGIEQAVVGSYVQTETYFIQHSDYLMPRVHQMRTDLAQYYHSKRPSVRLQNMVSPDERKFFEINGVDLLLIDLNVFCTTNANNRAILEQMKQIAASNNTAGQSLFEIGGIISASSMGTLNNVLREMDTKAQEKAEMEHQRALELSKAESDARQKEKKMENDHDALIQEGKNRTNLLVAEIRSAGFGATQDIDQNAISDFTDAMTGIKEDENYKAQFSFDQSKEDNKMTIANRKLDIEEQKNATAKEISDNQLKVAKENKTKSEIASKNKKKPS